MSDKNLFSKKNIVAKQPDTRTGIMEELNLPPAVISFVRKNSKNLQIGLTVVMILILTWVFYDYYTEKQESDAASLLASAMQTEEPAQRVQVLENVINDYSGTDAGLWGRIEMAHVDYREGRVDAAIMKYEEILADVDSGNSLAPLVRMNLAQSYEQAAQYDKAVTQYNMLKNSTGFADEAHLGLGRIYLAQGDAAKARQEYEKLLDVLDENADPQVVSRVQALIIATGGNKTITESQAEETKE